ncbi:uncharacterized protein LOC132739783 [Ruditapes philippinarum]|uniref:uncharacterized protein LOC132739783 n=1 Tax=Ruditapes philippinarum TaxID=129788 RepID=UPI00295BE243|nr:uncharacterized protein LOC132739783 [Ruditapes philippinarum]
MTEPSVRHTSSASLWTKEYHLLSASSVLSTGKDVSDKSSKRECIEEVFEWFQQLDQQSGSGDIVIRKEMFNQYYERLKEMINKDEHKTGQYFSVPRVQILDTRSTTAVSMFIQKLKFAMKQNRIDTAVIGTLTNALPETVLILVCNKGQGGSTEVLVEQCVKDVEPCHYNRIILVIMHILREDKLPKLPSSGKVIGEESFRKIGMMVDMGFYDNTIYQCDMNTKAIGEMLQFCKRFRCSDPTKASAPNQPHDSTVPPLKQTTDPIVSAQKQPTGSMEFGSVQENVIGINDKRNPRNMVYLVTPFETNAMSAFIKLFQARMRDFGFEIDEKEPSEARNLDPEPLLIIVCNATTRIESNINSCYDDNLRKVRNKTILIALHVIKKGKEPKLLTETKLAADSMFQNSSLKKIIDIAFDTEDGMYECTMNRIAEDCFRDLDAVLKSTTNEPK